MMHFTLVSLALAAPVQGLIGFGISMYQPNCAFACRDQFSGAHLECTSMEHGDGGHHGSSATSPECYAQDTAWLTTLAYCINQTCTDTPIYKLEAYWAERATKNARGNKLAPKWTYQYTLEELSSFEVPKRKLEEDEVLNFTALYNPESWESTRGALQHFELAETMHSRYAIVLLVVSFATPILVAGLGYLPFMSSTTSRIKPYIVWPSVLGTYHVRPLPFLLGNAPTIGQAWFIALFVLLNIIATAAGYRSFQHPSNSWFPDRWQEIIAYLSARTGVLAFALAPLTILFAGRNNILLWMTNWSHSTYLVLHRWIARIFTLQVILHSILEFILYQRQGEVATEQTEPYWIWGVVATVACVVMVTASTLYFRRKSYEFFLLLHIVLAVFVMAGSWYHVELLFQRKWGYECWLYAACGVWFSDRIIRVGRIFKNGMRHSQVTQITEDIMRIDIKDVRWLSTPGRHAYVFWPTLNPLRPWENHPFSVIPTALLRAHRHSIDLSSSSANSKHSSEDIEKSGVVVGSRTAASVGTPYMSTAGVSLYVRKSTGLTKALGRHAALRTLLDGPYPNNSVSGVLKCDRIVLIAGGIGITAVLPFVAHHSNIKLYWSLKSASQGLLNDLGSLLDSLREKVILVDQRINVASTLETEEAQGWKRIGVIVSGPGGLCDDVRSIVSRRGRKGHAVWELDVEAFSW